jgi:rhodanese-related sulfurtransferase
MGERKSMHTSYFLVAGANVSCVDMAERIPITELKKKLEAQKNFVLVDVREPGEIKESSAIPGAIHIPMAQIEKRMGELPRNAEIVFY